jgi:hypothetical protein
LNARDVHKCPRSAVELSTVTDDARLRKMKRSR